MDEDLKSYLDGKFGYLETQTVARFAAIDGKFAAIDGKFEELENRLIERMRDMQTELLRGFESFSAGQPSAHASLRPTSPISTYHFGAG